MGKITAPKIAIVCGIIAICIAGALLLRMESKREINAFVTPKTIVLGKTFHYADSTINAKQWHWEFGDGGESTLQCGDYKPNSPGVFAVRLTVDGELEKHFMINVIEPFVAKKDSATVITMKIPKVAMQGEYVTFTGIGKAKEWRWEFGESGRVDSRDKVAMFAYDQPGTYVVKLSTETTAYPIQKVIKIMPTEADDNLGDDNDVRIRLQDIVDGGSFNGNYNYILSKYLNGNPNMMVVVNNSKDGNSFWSYCQGLKMAGRGATHIISAVVDIDETSGRVNKLVVMQESKQN
jgi:hypothetical protein